MAQLIKRLSRLIRGQQVRSNHITELQEYLGSFQIINGADWGMLGNDSFNNATALQAAVDAAEASTYGLTIYLPPGHFNFGSQLTVANKKVTIIGAGMEDTVLHYTGSTSPALDTTGSTSESGALRMYNLSFKGNANATNGLDIENAQRYAGFKNLLIDAWPGIGMKIDNTHTIVLDNVLFYNCDQAFDFGATFCNSAQLRMVSIEECDDTTWVARIQNAISVNWIGGTIEANASGLRFDSCWGGSIQGTAHELNGTATPYILCNEGGGFLIMNNSFRGTTNETAIQLGANAVTASQRQGYTVMANDIQGFTNCIEFGVGGVGPRRPVIIDNSYYNSTNQLVFTNVAFGPVLHIEAGTMTWYDTSGNVTHQIPGSQAQITGTVKLDSNTIGFRSAAPTAGTWAQGDIVWNTGAAVGSPQGWRCTVAGTPGTWVAMANL